MVGWLTKRRVRVASMSLRMEKVETLEALNQVIINCYKCPRLVVYREQIAREKKRMYRSEEYWGRPVPGWGDARAHVYIVGLAPAAHGGNRTGRVFTDERRGFLDTSDYHENLVVRPKDVHDNARPSGSTMATMVLFKLGRIRARRVTSRQRRMQ